MTDDDYRAKMRESVKQFLEDSPFDENLWNDFAKRLFYVAGDVGSPELYKAIGEKLQMVEQTFQTSGNVFLLIHGTQPLRNPWSSRSARLVENLSATTWLALAR